MTKASDSTVDPFEGPRKLLSWAREDLAEIERRWTRYLARNPYRVFTELNGVTGRHECKLRVKSNPPEGMDKLAHNAANAIRHSFDQTMWVVTRIIDPTWQRDVYFPWGTSPNDTKGKLKRTPLPEEVQHILLSIEPYNTGDGHSGGDNLLRDFAKSVNPGKHRFSVTVAPNLAPTAVSVLGIDGGPIDTTLRLYYGVRVATKGEHPIAAILSSNGEIQYKFDVSCSVVFGDGIPLSGRPILEALSHALTKSEDIIERLSIWQKFG